MCGRYALYETDRLADRFAIDDVVGDDEIAKNYNVAPEQIMPVITEDENGRHLDFMRWGIPRYIGKDVQKELINTRAESAFTPFWRKLVSTQRLLVPANGFYEWQRRNEGPKQPYLIHPKDEDLFAFAGIWSTWQDEGGQEWRVYSIMTTEANQEMSVIHNRMPVILHEEDEATWLDPANDKDTETLESLLHPYEDRGLEMYEVSRDVNVVRNNNDRLIYPINSK
jgi:putative SOS response-associated peptidase YedK